MLTPSFRFFVSHLKKPKQTAHFSLIRPFMEYGATVWDPYQKYNSDNIERVQRRAARFVKSMYSSVSDICLMCWDGRLFLKGDGRLDLLFLQNNYRFGTSDLRRRPC